MTVQEFRSYTTTWDPGVHRNENNRPTRLVLLLPAAVVLVYHRRWLRWRLVGSYPWRSVLSDYVRVSDVSWSPDVGMEDPYVMSRTNNQLYYAVQRDVQAMETKAKELAVKSQADAERIALAKNALKEPGP